MRKAKGFLVFLIILIVMGIVTSVAVVMVVDIRRDKAAQEVEEKEKADEATLLANINTLDFHYENNSDGSLCIYSYTPTKIVTELAVPASIDGKMVTKIEGIFSGNDDIKRVILPNTLTNIGANSFKSCDSLEEIEVNSNSLVFEEDAIIDCENLQTIDFENGVIYFKDASIHGCKKLKNISLPNNVIIDGNTNFADCGDDLIITCGSNSAAQNYCLENNIAFKTIKEGEN